jgi:hypothetical protein
MSNASFAAALIILLLLVPIVADIAAGGDVWKMQRQEEVSHRWGARLRGLVLGLPCLTLILPRLMIEHGSSVLQVATSLAPVLLRVVLLWFVLLVEFWIAFDLRVNKRWGKAWDYIGGTASLDTLSGRLLSKFDEPGIAYFVLKLTIFGALLAVFCLLVF